MWIFNKDWWEPEVIKEFGDAEWREFHQVSEGICDTARADGGCNEP